MGKEVPLKLDGEVIGKAVVNDDGSIDATVNAPTELGNRVRKLLNRHLISGLSFDATRQEVVTLIKKES